MNQILLSLLRPFVGAAIISVLGASLNMLLLVAFAFPFQWAWNAAVPLLLKLPSLDYGAAVGVLAVWSILNAVREGIKMKAKFRDTW